MQQLLLDFNKKTICIITNGPLTDLINNYHKLEELNIIDKTWHFTLDNSIEESLKYLKFMEYPHLVKLVDNIIEEKSNMIMSGELKISTPVSVVVKANKKFLEVIDNELQYYLGVNANRGPINGLDIEFEYADIPEYELTFINKNSC